MIVADTAEGIWRLAEKVRRTAPLVYNVTNLVMQSGTAEAIAAVGGTQMTLHSVEEVCEVAAQADALAVNLGTLDEPWLACARQAVKITQDRNRPWVLDPVAIGLTRYRTKSALDLLSRRPTVVKGNASEILAISGSGEKGRAADSAHLVEQAAGAAVELARRHHCVVVTTGKADLVTDGDRLISVRNGAALMGHMIGSGCMLTSLIGCYLAVAADPFDAALAAVAVFTVAGEVAAAQAQGPGTLKPHLLDCLYGMNEDLLRERLVVS